MYNSNKLFIYLTLSFAASLFLDEILEKCILDCIEDLMIFEYSQDEKNNMKKLLSTIPLRNSAKSARSVLERPESDEIQPLTIQKN